MPHNQIVFKHATYRGGQLYGTVQYSETYS